MAGVALKILTGAAVQRLQGLEARGDNLSGLFRFFGAYMLGSIQRNFDAGGRPPWAPLSLGAKIAWHTQRKSFWNKKGSAMTQAGKSAWGGRQVLTDTGRLRRSIQPTALSNGLILGTNVVYAAIHQFGGQAGRGRKVTLPARPYLVFQDEDVAYFGKLLNGYLLTGRLT